VTTGERIERELAEEWSGENLETGDYCLDLDGDEYRTFFLELRQKIDAAIKGEREKSLGEQVKDAVKSIREPNPRSGLETGEADDA
jgi:hypothetical protein